MVYLVEVTFKELSAARIVYRHLCTWYRARNGPSADLTAIGQDKKVLTLKDEALLGELEKMVRQTARLKPAQKRYTKSISP